MTTISLSGLPEGTRIRDTRPDIELTEKGTSIAAEDGLTLGEGMQEAMKRDPALALRYQDYTLRLDPFHKLSERSDAARAEDHRLTSGEATKLVLAEDPSCAPASMPISSPPDVDGSAWCASPGVGRPTFRCPAPGLVQCLYRACRRLAS